MPDTFIEITADQGRMGRLWWINSNHCARQIQWNPEELQRWVMWGGWGFAFDWFQQIDWEQTPI